MHDFRGMPCRKITAVPESAGNGRPKRWASFGPED